MNILIFNYEYPPLGGGGGVATALIAEELATRHGVTVVTSGTAAQAREENMNGVEVLRVPVFARRATPVASLPSMASYLPGAWRTGWRLLQQRRFDVVNSHFAVPTGPASLPLAKLAHVPHVLSLHGGDVYDPSKRLSPHRIAPLRWSVSAILRASDSVVAQSTNTRDNAYRYYSYRGPIEIIPLGIRQPAIPPVSREVLGLPPHAIIAVTVGRLVTRKRIEHLLRALAGGTRDSIVLVVVGDGPELEHLQHLAAALGVAERTRFLGQVSEETKWQVLQAADVYVSATMHEGFGLVYLEAMAAGLPVITYDEGGQVDFLRHGQTGYLIREGDISALQAAFDAAVADPAALRDIGRANRGRAPEFDVRRAADAYERLFDGVRSGAGKTDADKHTGRRAAEPPIR